MPYPDFKCKNCGKCCVVFEDAYNHEVNYEQVQIWEDNVPHVLDWVAEGPFGMYYICWISPITGDYVERCPWLRIYKSPRYKNVKGARCLIQDWKPDVCRNFPQAVIHALSIGCKGFDHLPEERLKHLLTVELINVLQQIVSAKSNA